MRRPTRAAARGRGADTRRLVWDATAECLCSAPVLEERRVGTILADTGAEDGGGKRRQENRKGGNVWEWNEAVVASVFRSVRGGGFDVAGGLAAAAQLANGPTGELGNLGFRVASVAAHPIPVMSPAGLLVFAAGLLGFIGYYRRRF